MGMNIVAAGIVLLAGYLWLTRGFFSAFLSLLCVVAAGAVAFAVWEPLGYLLLEKAPARGFFGTFIEGSAWGIALAFPFAATLAILRVGVDSLLRRNVRVGAVPDYIGGGICGVLAGVIISGITVLSVGFLRLPTDLSFLGYNPVTFDGQGSIKRGEKLWVPTDRMTEWFYATLSTQAFASSQPLATWHPDLYLVPGSLRHNANKGASKNTIRKNQFIVVSSYAVNPAKANLSGKAAMDSILRDKWRPAPQAGVMDIDGNVYQGDAKLFGYVIQFQGEAKEKASGQVLLGNAQVRVVAKNAQGETRSFFPFATLAAYQLTPDQLEALKDKGSPIRFARFPFNSGGDGIYIPSVGGGTEARFGLEFIVPNDFTPIALYVRNTRHQLTAPPAQEFASAAARDSAIDRLMGGSTRAAEFVEDSSTFTVGNQRSDKPLDAPPENGGVSLDNRMVAGSFNLVIQRDQVGPGVNVARRGGRSASWAVNSGEAEYSAAEIASNRALDADLRVDAFAAGDGVMLVRVNIGMDTPWGLGERGLPVDKPITLIDADGNAYDAIGYVYRDNQKVRIRYTPDQPLVGLQDFPSLTRSLAGQSCSVYFRVTNGVVVNRLAVGERVVLKWAPPFRVQGLQR